MEGLGPAPDARGAAKSWRTLALEAAIREADADAKAAGRELEPLDLILAVANARGAPAWRRRKAQKFAAPFLAAQEVLRRRRLTGR